MELRPRLAVWLSSHETLLLVLGLSASILFTFLPALDNGPVWDDRPLVLDNPHLNSVGGLAALFRSDLWTASGQSEPSSYYRPLSMASFWLNRWLGGGSAASFHAGNIALHLLNANLLALLLIRLGSAGGAKARVSFVFALAWSLAPLSSEPVYWISGRFDLLVATFALMAALVARANGRFAQPLAVIAMSLGLFCKESFISLVPLLLMDDLLVRRAGARALMTKYAALTGVVVFYLLLRRALGIPSLSAATDTGVGPSIRSFFSLVHTFTGQLLCPTALDPFRPYGPPTSSRLVATGTLFFGAVGGVVYCLFRRRAEPAWRVVLLGIAWFALGLVPNAIVGPNLEMVGDRYAYAPVIGVAVAGSGLASLLNDSRPRPTTRNGLWVAFRVALIVILGAEAALTWRRASDWRDDRTLAESSLRSSPENPYALYTLGKMAAERSEFATAQHLLDRSLRGNPESWRTWDAVCFVKMHAGELTEAEMACKRSLSKHGRNPRAWANLASVYVRSARWVDAASAAHEAVGLKPTYAYGHLMAAVAAANLGDVDRARWHVARGLEVDPLQPGLVELRRELDKATNR